MTDRYTGRDVVFLLGSPRSGTTWVQKLLASHPKIATAQESNFFITYARSLIRNWNDDVRDRSGRGGTGLPCYLNEDQFYAVLAELFKKTVLDIGLRDACSSTLFVEKTPSHALVVDDIHRILPEARYLLLIRDPRDVVSSILAAHKTWGKGWAPSNMFTALVMWYRHTVAARESLERLPDCLSLTLRYEDLLSEPEKTLASVFSFLGLELGRQELASLIEMNAIGSRRPANNPLKVFGLVGAKLQGVIKEPEGFVRRGKSGTWREDLGVVKGTVIKYLARKEIKRYGYF
jgi:hypothetical protein